MTSSISIVSYLWKDILWRWCEQPGGVITRLVVTGVLALASLALLGGFVLLGADLRAKLVRNGADLVFVSEFIESSGDDLAPAPAHPRLELLRGEGPMFQLLQLFANASAPPAKPVRVAAYPEATIPHLKAVPSAAGGVLYLSETLPAGMKVRLEIEEHCFDAVVARPPDMIAKYYQDEVILVPVGLLPRVEARGFTRLTLLKVSDLRRLPALERALRLTSELDGSRWYIRSSTNILMDFDRLQSSHLTWRMGLSVTAGSIIALVLGTLSILEYHQRAYVIALMRSFGVGRFLLWGMQWVENTLIVNVSALAACAVLFAVQDSVYSLITTENGQAALDPAQMREELLIVLLCINAGALLGTLPAAHAMRKSVGEVLG